MSGSVASPTRVGVVGLNARAERLILPGLVASPRARVTALCSRDPAKAESIAQTIPDAHAFHDPLAMIESGLVDALFVNTPLNTHAALCRAAIRARLAVICEKPLSPTAAESASLAAEASRAGVPTAVNFTYRSVLGYRLTERRLRSAPLGHLLLARFELLQGHNFLAHVPRASALLDSGCHLFDLMASLLLLAGAGPIGEVCGAPFSSPHPLGAPDHGWSFIVRTESGLTVPASFTRQALGWRNGLRWALSGTSGAIEVETDGPYLRARTAAADNAHPSGRWLEVAPPDDLAADDSVFPQFQMDRLVAAIRGEEPFPTFADAVFPNLFAEALAQSAHERRWMKLHPF